MTKELEERTDDHYESLIDELQNQVSHLELQLDERCKTLSEAKSIHDNDMIVQEDLTHKLDESSELFIKESNHRLEAEKLLSDVRDDFTKAKIRISSLEDEVNHLNNVFTEERDRMEESINGMEHRAIHAEENVHHLQDTIQRLTDDLRNSQEKTQALVTDVATLKVCSNICMFIFMEVI